MDSFRCFSTRRRKVVFPTHLQGEEYERITVQCTDGTEVIAYHWVAPLDGLRALDDGRWRARR